MKKFPPGYKDSSKGQGDDTDFIYAGLRYERQYGDLIIWKQMIKKTSDEKIKSVIFITDDSKEDWWKIEDCNGKKIIGPRPELVEEMRSEASIDLFMMYKTSEFLAAASRAIKVEIDKGSVEDAKNIFESVNTERNIVANHIYPKNFRDINDAYKEHLKNEEYLLASMHVNHLLDNERVAKSFLFPKGAYEQLMEFELNEKNGAFSKGAFEQLLEDERKARSGIISQSVLDQYAEAERNARNSILPKSLHDQLIKDEERAESIKGLYEKLVDRKKNKLK